MSRIDDAVRDLHSLDLLAARRTPLSALDPRARIVVALAYVVTVLSFERHAVAALLPLALFPVAAAAVADLPWRLVGRKLALALPFALMVGLFNPLYETQPMLLVGGLTISAGWVSFASILLRFCLSVMAVVVLVGSTGFHELCLGLRRLGLPPAFTTQLLFLHRYVLVLAGEASRMTLARQLRAGGAASMPLPVYASLLGHLLLRAFERAERIHLAMLARGFDGELRSRHGRRWTTTDTLFVVACVTAFAVIRHVDLARGIGGLLIGALA